MARWLEQVAKQVEAHAEGKPPPPPPSSPLSREFQGLVRSLAEDLKRQLHEPANAPLPKPSLPIPPPEEPLPQPEEHRAPEPAMDLESPQPPPPLPIPTPSGPIPPPEEPLPLPEERRALETALGIATPQPPALEEDLARLIASEVAKPSGTPPAPAPQPPPAAEPAALDDVTRLIESELAQKSAEPPKPSPPRPEPAPAPPPEPAPPVSEPLDLMGHEVFAVRALNSCWTALLRLLTMCDLLVPAPLLGRKTLLGRIGMGLTALAVAGLAWVAYRRLS